MPAIPTAIAAALALAALVLTACAHRQNGDYWAGVSAGVAHVEKQK